MHITLSNGKLGLTINRNYYEFDGVTLTKNGFPIDRETALAEITEAGYNYEELKELETAALTLHYADELYERFSKDFFRAWYRFLEQKFGPDYDPYDYDIEWVEDILSKPLMASGDETVIIYDDHYEIVEQIKIYETELPQELLGYIPESIVDYLFNGAHAEATVDWMLFWMHYYQLYGYRIVLTGERPVAERSVERTKHRIRYVEFRTTDGAKEIKFYDEDLFGLLANNFRITFYVSPAVFGKLVDNEKSYSNLAVDLANFTQIKLSEAVNNRRKLFEVLSNQPILREILTDYSLFEELSIEALLKLAEEDIREAKLSELTEALKDTNFFKESTNNNFETAQI